MLGIIIILLIPPSQVPPLLVPQELEEGHIIHPRSSRFLHLFCLLVITLPAAGVPKKVKKEGIALLSLLLPQSPEISHNESIFNSFCSESYEGTLEPLLNAQVITPVPCTQKVLNKCSLDDYKIKDEKVGE